MIEHETRKMNTDASQTSNEVDNERESSDDEEDESSLAPRPDVNPLAEGSAAVDCVVLDTAAFVMAAPIERWARTAFTVPEV